MSISVENEQIQCFSRLKSCIHKKVAFRFSDVSLCFALSQSLFSSFNVDRGTRLLLKCLLEHIDLKRIDKVLDMGCGTGILGLCLKKRYPALNVMLTDRDALALEFSHFNAILNRITPLNAEGRLGFSGFDHSSNQNFDLIVSNLPAKAGHTVLKNFIYEGCTCINPGGSFACVIVSSLRKLLQEFITGLGAKILVQNHTKDYSVFIFNPIERMDTEYSNGHDDLSCYIRGKFNFHYLDKSWLIPTVYNLPDFDNLSHETMLILYILNRSSGFKEPALFWNPGQGHIPLFYTQKTDQSLCALGSRDLLQLKISSRNLKSAGIQIQDIYHLPFIEDIQSSFRTIIVKPDPDEPAPESLLLECARLLTGEGRLILIARSTIMNRILKYRSSFAIKQEKKSKGFHAVLLKKK